MTPKQWCYPVVGCVAYRGYFDASAAKAMRDELAAQGYDVDIYGVKAYSTLSWFNDPVLNTFLDGADSQLASLIFHELSHQVVYVADDCAFNEAFAKTVEMEGLRRWLQANSTAGEWQRYQEREKRGDEFLDMLRQVRVQLLKLYAQPLPDDAKRTAKRDILSKLDADLRSRRNGWPNPMAVDAWLARGLNNARLAAIATYENQVPVFHAMLETLNRDLPAFYVEVGRLAKLPAIERAAKLKAYGVLDMPANCADETSNPH